MADLATIKNNVKESLVVELKLSGETLLNDGDDTPMTITVNGPNSKAAAEVNFDLQDEAIREYKKDPESSSNIDARKMDQTRKKRVIKQATDWNITLEGKKPKFSEKALTEFFEDFPMFFLQVEEAIELDSGFILA